MHDLDLAVLFKLPGKWGFELLEVDKLLLGHNGGIRRTGCSQPVEETRLGFPGVEARTSTLLIWSLGQMHTKLT